MSQERMQGILKMLERLPVPVVIANPLTAKVLWVNTNLVRIGRGSHPDQFVGRSVLEFIRAEQMSRALIDLAAVAAGKSPKPVIYDLQRLDGERAAVHVSSIPMLFYGQPAMLSLVTDVSDRERLIRDLEQSEERYKLLLDNTPSGIVVVVDRQVVFANNSIARALGLPNAAALIGEDMFDYIAPEFHAPVRDARREVMRSGKPHAAAPVTLVRADGGRFDTTAATARIWWDGILASQTLMHELPITAEGPRDASATDRR